MSRVTEVVIILDRSGSMASIRESTVQGINTFISDVQKVPGEGYWTLVLFDDYPSANGAGESFPNVVFEKRPDREMKDFNLVDFVPRGGTALIDAVCVTIQRIKDRWLSLPEIQRSKIMIVIMTDGQENASRNFSRDAMRQLTAEVQAKYGWEFMYLGANQDAFAEANDMGIQKTCGGILYQGSNAVNYVADTQGVLGAFNLASRGTRDWKAGGNPTAEDLLGDATPAGIDLSYLQDPVKEVK